MSTSSFGASLLVERKKPCQERMYKILWVVKSCLWHVFALVSYRQGAADKIQPLPIWKQTWLCPLLSEGPPGRGGLLYFNIF